VVSGPVPVPVCSTVGVPAPSSPTQKLENGSATSHVTVGCVQELDTLVKVPAEHENSLPSRDAPVARHLLNR